MPVYLAQSASESAVAIEEAPAPQSRPRTQKRRARDLALPQEAAVVGGEGETKEDDALTPAAKRGKRAREREAELAAEFRAALSALGRDLGAYATELRGAASLARFDAAWRSCAFVVMAVLFSDTSSTLSPARRERARGFRALLATSDAPREGRFFAPRENAPDPLALVIEVHTPSAAVQRFSVIVAHEPPGDELLALRNAVLPLLEDGDVLKVAFDCKSVLTVLLGALRLCALRRFPPPALIDPQLAAWCVDPDHVFSAFDADSLLTAYSSASPHAGARVAPGEWGTLRELGLSARAEAGLAALREAAAAAVEQAPSRGLASAELATLDHQLRELPGLWRLLERELDKWGLWPVFLTQEMPMSCVLAEMQLVGVGFNPAPLAGARARLVARCAELEQQAHAAAGETFLVRSPLQLARVLFDQLRLPQLSSAANPNKPRSTTRRVLQKLTAYHELPRLVLAYRACAKLLGTYIDPLVAAALPARSFAAGDAGDAFTPLSQATRSRRVFTSWLHINTGTGRLSSMRPNLMCLPRPPGDALPLHAEASARADGRAAGADDDGDEGDGEDDAAEAAAATVAPNVRSAFTADEDFVLVAADYSQMEMRILAHVSGDEGLQQLLRASGGDVYKQLAARCFGRPVQDVTPQDRALAKAIGLGIVYGLGAENLVEQLSAAGFPLDVAAARELKERHFLAKFPAVRNFINRTQAQVRRTHHVVTLCGRKRFLGHVASAAEDERARALRQAVNSVVQGSASDLMKQAMLRIRFSFQEQRIAPAAARIVLQVHDEIVVEAHRSVADAVIHIVRECMETLLLDQSRVPFPVTVKVGPSLGELVEAPASSGGGGGE